MNKNYFLEVFLLILLVVLTHSYLPTVSEVLSSSGSADFQWQPAKCVFEGINHYQSYLASDGNCKVFMSQLGEYAQGFYVLIYPFTVLDWNNAKFLWFLFNVTLIISTSFLLCKKFELGKIESYLIIFFILYSIIARVNFIMGQQTIFVLFFLTLPFIYKSKLSTILSGISYFKYNIGYALFFLYLISKEYKKIIFSIIPCFIGLIIYCYITNSNILKNIFQPFELMFFNSAVGSTLNRVFLFSFFRDFSIFDEFTNYLLIGIFTLLFNFFFIRKISKINNNLLKLSCLCLLILISTPHWGHDYILLVPLLIYSVKYYKFDLFLFRINLLVCVYFLHLYKGIQIYLNVVFSYFKINTYFLSDAYPYTDVLMLLIILILNLISSSSKKNPRNFHSEGSNFV
jgi:hypothetical protein